MDAAKTLVEEKIAGKKVMVFSKSTCNNCTKAKSVLQKYLQSGELSSEDYEVLEFENRPDYDAILDYLREKTGARTVPRVFINGTCIGGGSDMEQMDRSGQLLPLLEA